MHKNVLPPRLLGMLTPSSNTVLEPYTSALLQPLFPSVTAHFGRFRVTRIALDDDANEQFRLGPILSAAELLSDARPDIIAWNGTSASWLGFETDERLCGAIEARTGVPATSAILSLNRLLRERGFERIALVSPYTGDIAERIAQNYARLGISTVAGRHRGLSDNFSFAQVSEREISAMCEDVAAERPQAIIIICTNMRGSLVGVEIEQRLGIPVLDSVSFALWGCLKALNMPMKALGQFGSIFGGEPEACMSASPMADA
jgi:maleate isomerase